MVNYQFDMLGESRNFLPQLVRSIARQGMRCLEIGSWTGESSAIIANVCKEFGGSLYCVDWWQGSESEPFLKDIAATENIFATFESNIRSQGLSDYVNVLKMRSSSAAGILKDDYFDFVFIDADHCYCSVVEDIQNYRSKVKVGGIFAGHDCEMLLKDCVDKEIVSAHKDIGWYAKQNESWIPGIGLHCGVIQAVGELVPDAAVRDRIWFCNRHASPSAQFQL
jgi:SAM-dependent methyltransferase